MIKVKKTPSWQLNSDIVEKFVKPLDFLEESGKEDGLTDYYYSSYNEAFISGLDAGLSDKHKLTYMGFLLILDKLYNAISYYEYQNPRRKIEKTSQFRITIIGPKHVSVLKSIFNNYVSNEYREFYLKPTARVAYAISGLNIRKDNRLLFPYTLGIIHDTYKSFGIVPFSSSAYMTFPVWSEGHLSDEEQKDNITTFIKYLCRNYKQKGGCSALLDAGVGTGKTRAIAILIAPIIGRILGAPVYMLVPTTPQVAQVHEQYGANTNYGASTASERTGSDSITSVIYDKADDINIMPTTVDGRPIVLIIDEAHSLLTEAGYRNLAIKKIIRLAKQVLEAGGIVLSMTASSEIIAANMPFNTRSGYDFVCIAYRVTAKNSVFGKPYPAYDYYDVIQHGDTTGVHIVSAIPAHNIEVYYRTTNAPKEKYIIKLIMHDLNFGNLPIVENNDKDSNVKIAQILSSIGVKVAVISSDDKGYTFDENKNCRVYNNETYEDIINKSSIDRDKTEVLLTTKLLENGTSINRIVSGHDYDVCTYYIVNRKTDFDIQAFEQFSGRVRCEHLKACLLLPMIENKEGYIADLPYYIRCAGKRKNLQVAEVSNNAITEERLNYLDLNGEDDFEDDIVRYKTLTANTISKVTYSALKKYYKSLMFNRQAFESYLGERYHGKNIKCVEMPEPNDIDIRKGRDIVEDDNRQYLSEAIQAAYYGNYEADKKVRCDDHDALCRALGKCARGSYKENIIDAIEVHSFLKDVKEGKVQTNHFNANKLDFDSSDKAVNEFIMMVTEAATSTTKKNTGAILNDVNMALLNTIIGVPGVAEYIRKYAYRKSSHDELDTERLTEEVVRLMGIDDFAEITRAKGVLLQLFSSDKFLAICRIIAVCTLMASDFQKICNFATRSSEDKLNQLVLCYECWYMTTYPDVTYPHFTPSGRQYASLFSWEAFVVCGFEAYPSIQIYDHYDNRIWISKTLTREKCLLMAEFIRKGMVLNGESAPSDLNMIARRIIRVFATVFSMSQKKEKGGFVYVIRDVRKHLPADFSKILDYTFI